jgi:membrane-associated phospholipid phosphatase
MALSGAAILAFSFVGCRLTLITLPDLGQTAIALALLIPISFLLPIYWHEKGRMEMRDAALTIPWCLLFRSVLPCTVGIAGRLGRNRPLEDSSFVRLDQALRFQVWEVSAWASHHWLGHFINSTYSLLTPLLFAAFFLPALTGKVKNAQRFIVSNLVAFLIGMPLFSFFPAVGPWFGYHLAAASDPLVCQHNLEALRTPGPYTLMVYGVVCFPSFHVIWVIICADALWAFKFLRVPTFILAILIILSTITGGWHYLVDVLAGLLVGVAAVAAAHAICRPRAC